MTLGLKECCNVDLHKLATHLAILKGVALSRLDGSNHSLTFADADEAEVRDFLKRHGFADSFEVINVS
jgi:hypothetical protein